MNVKSLVITIMLFSLFLTGLNLTLTELNYEQPEKRMIVQEEVSLSSEETQMEEEILDYVIKKEKETYDKNIPSPSDWVKENQIKVYNDRVVLDIKDAQWARFTDTKSMDPVIDAKANALELVPTREDQIQVGDIISFNTKFTEGTIIHRVIEIGKDDEGTYYITKGDNNENPDPGKVRFEQIQRVLIAIIY